MAKHFADPEPDFDSLPDEEWLPGEELQPDEEFAAEEGPQLDEEPLAAVSTPVDAYLPAMAATMRRDPRDDLPAWLDLLVTAVITVAVVLVVRALVLDTYEVPTGSMLETIQLGDRLIGEKVSYRLRPPRQGEVITFADPTDPKVTLIKRVVATGGQVVDLVDGVVVVDGVALDEPYTLGKPSEPLQRHATTLSEDVSYPYVVPEGCVWVMGDNRTNSLDSRYFGAIPLADVTARAVLIFWPPADAGTL